MKTNELITTVRNFQGLAAQVKRELAMVDSGLRDEVRKEREGAVWAKHGENLAAMLQKIRAGREEIKGMREAESDTTTALIRKAWARADDFKPGMALIAEAFQNMEPARMIGFAKEFNHPAMTLKAMNVLNSRDLGNDDRMNLGRQLQELSGTFVDRAAIRGYAEAEVECLRAEFLHMQDFGGDTAKKLNIGHEIAHLEKLAAQ